MSKRSLALVLTVAALGVSLLAVAPAGAAPGGGECQLQGTANLSPALSSTSSNFTYSFSGALSGCQSNLAGAPTAGTVSAGITLPESVTLTNTSTGTTTTGTVSYQEPVASGTGSCGNSTTSGVSLSTWNDGKHTVVGYSTNGAAAAVALQGTVVASMTLSLVASSVPAGFTAPSTFTIASDEPTFAVGEGALGALTFSPATQDQNCVTVGVSTATINGTIGIGSQS